MENAASEISDWEVLSAASACQGDGLDDMVVVSVGVGDVLPDHFTLDLATPDAGFSIEGSWLEPEVGFGREEQRDALELSDGFDSISQEGLDLVAGLSSVQLQEGGVGENGESSVLQAAAACGAICCAEGRQAEAVGLETQQENDAARSCGELDRSLQPAHHVVGEPLNSDATTATDASPQSEVSDNSRVQLEDIGVDASIEASCTEDFVTTDGVHGGQAEQNQGTDDYARSGCDEADGSTKDGALPLVQASGAGKEGKQVVVWWRLPFKLQHYCAWNVKPAWSFSIAAALLGLVMLGRKMYRMKHKAKGLPQIKIAFDDKRASQYANRAARLNEAFMIARRVPMLPWSMVHGSREMSQSAEGPFQKLPVAGICSWFWIIRVSKSIVVGFAFIPVLLDGISRMPGPMPEAVSIVRNFYPILALF